MKEFIFTWSIENFSYAWHKTGEPPIVSPIFLAGPMHNSAWRLMLYPRGIEDSDFVSMYLFRTDDKDPETLAFNFEFSCISVDTSATHSCFIPENFNTFRKNGNFGESCFINRRDIFGTRKALHLPKDVLTLRCKMWKNDGKADEFEYKFGRTKLTTEQIISVSNINLANKQDKTFSLHSKSQNKTVMSVSILYFDDKIYVEIDTNREATMKFSTLKFSYLEKRTGKNLCEFINSFFGASKNEIWVFPLSVQRLPTEIENSDKGGFEFITEFVYSTGETNNELETKCWHEENLSLRNSEFLSNYGISCVPSGKITDCPTISDDVWNLFAQKDLCDVELKTQTASFFAHKAVLCARSSVFSAMLTGEMKEKIEKCVVIEDISDVTLKSFLHFLYIDSFEDLEMNALIGLYYAADKYQVERLKLFCCSHLLKNIDIDKVCELLILADRHNDCELKRRVDDFIWENEEQIFRSVTWKKLAYDQPQLAMQIMLSKYEEKEDHDPLETYEDQISLAPTIQDGFRSLYQGHIASDVVIKTGGVTFPAHKSVLCASSSTFREMFRNDTIGKSLEVVKMEEWEDDTVSRMLFFLYTDSLEDTQWDTAIKLYQVAATYKIRRLQIKCSCFFFENVSVSNAADLLLVAHEHRDANLKSVVEDYILLHDEEIFGSDEWAAFSKTNLLLANETMRAKYKKIK